MAKLSTMQDLSWSVICQNSQRTFWWLYVFSGSGSVRWKDENNGMTGSGTWKVQGSKLYTRWTNSATTEVWDVPIDTDDWNGTCTMKGIGYSLKAKARNYVEAREVHLRSKDEKAEFLKNYTLGLGFIQHSQLAMEVWLSTVAIVYGKAYASHSELMKSISATEKLGQEMLLGFALAFVGGAAGGALAGFVGDAVKEVMKSAESQGFIIDGIKDLAKYSVRGTGSEVFRAKVDAKMPTDPFLWDKSVRKVVYAEFTLVSSNLNSWMDAVDKDKDDLPEDFDPNQEIQNDLKITIGGVPTPITKLPKIDEDALQTSFEKGWFVGWVEKYGSTVTVIPGFRASVKDALIEYGRKVGMPDAYQFVDKHVPIEYDPQLIYSQ